MENTIRTEQQELEEPDPIGTPFLPRPIIEARGNDGATVSGMDYWAGD